jgi:hypothetical protein
MAVRARIGLNYLVNASCGCAGSPQMAYVSLPWLVFVAAMLTFYFIFNFKRFNLRHLSAFVREAHNIPAIVCVRHNRMNLREDFLPTVSTPGLRRRNKAGTIHIFSKP